MFEQVEMLSCAEKVQACQTSFAETCPPNVTAAEGSDRFVEILWFSKPCHFVAPNLIHVNSMSPISENCTFYRSLHGVLYFLLAKAADSALSTVYTFA